MHAAGAGVAFQAFQIRAHFCGALVTQVAILLHALVDHLRKFGWNSGIQTNGIDGIFVQDFIENCARSIALKRKHARRHFVKHAAEGEQVAARVQFFAENLLG